jgi:4-carboxymuconolactone decarboxylase
MSRVAGLRSTELSPEQKCVHDEIAGARGGLVRGPFAVWIRIPAIANAANQLGNSIRLQGKLDRRLFELAILIVARHWTAQYEWFVHERDARAAGLSDGVIAAIRDRRSPETAKPDERLVYDLVTELLETKTISDKSFHNAVEHIGIDVLVELTTTVGFYTTAAMMINVFDSPVPDGSKPLP